MRENEIFFVSLNILLMFCNNLKCKLNGSRCYKECERMEDSSDVSRQSLCILKRRECYDFTGMQKITM